MRYAQAAQRLVRHDVGLTLAPVIGLAVVPRCSALCYAGAATIHFLVTEIICSTERTRRSQPRENIQQACHSQNERPRAFLLTVIPSHSELHVGFESFCPTI